MSPGRAVLSASLPAQPRPAAPPCAAPTRPARGVSGFWIRQVSNCHGARKCGFGAKSGPKKTSCSGRARQGNVARDDYRHVTRPSTCTIFPRRTVADALEDDRSSAGPLPAA